MPILQKRRLKHRELTDLPVPITVRQHANPGLPGSRTYAAFIFGDQF